MQERKTTERWARKPTGERTVPAGPGSALVLDPWSAASTASNSGRAGSSQDRRLRPDKNSKF